MADSACSPLSEIRVPDWRHRRRLGLLLLLPPRRHPILLWRRYPSRGWLLSRSIFLRLSMGMLSLCAVPHQDHDGEHQRQNQDSLEYAVEINI